METEDEVFAHDNRQTVTVSQKNSKSRFVGLKIIGSRQFINKKGFAQHEAFSNYQHSG
jgi:hypothetical protein